MRLIAAIVTCLALLAAAWFGWQLWQGVQPPVGSGSALGAVSAGAETAEGEISGDITGETTPSDPTVSDRAAPWPPLFGELQPPTPQAPSPPKPAAPDPVKPASGPPLDSLGYQLKGVMRVGGEAWGIVFHPTGERILRVGDDLQEGLSVARIDAEGLWVRRAGEAPQLLGFVETP